jgi:aminoglycoside phosphotransferase (APT) family kinase protein
VLPAGDPLGRKAIRGATGLVAAALSWLADVHRVLAPDAAVRELIGSELAQTGEAHVAAFGDGADLRARFRDRLAGAGSLGRAVRAPQHGDFVLSNVRFAGDQVGVIDWERFGRVGLPGFDALHFVNYTIICLVADPKTHQVDPQAVLAHVLAPSPLGDPLRAELRRYLSGQGLDPDALPLLYLAYLAAFGHEYGAEPERRGIVGTMGALLRAALAR